MSTQKTELVKPLPFGDYRRHDTDQSIRSLINQALSNYQEGEDLIVDVLTDDQIAYYDEALVDKKCSMLGYASSFCSIMDDLDGDARTNAREIRRWLSRLEIIPANAHEFDDFLGFDFRFEKHTKPPYRMYLRVSRNDIPALRTALESPCQLNPLPSFQEYKENLDAYDKRIISHLIKAMTYTIKGYLIIDTLSNEQVRTMVDILNSLPVSLRLQEHPNYKRREEEIHYVQEIANTNLNTLRSWFNDTNIPVTFHRKDQVDRRFGTLPPDRSYIVIPPESVENLLQLIRLKGDKVSDFQLSHSPTETKDPLNYFEKQAEEFHLLQIKAQESLHAKEAALPISTQKQSSAPNLAIKPVADGANLPEVPAPLTEPSATTENTPSANLTLNILGWIAVSVGILALTAGLLFTFGVFPAVLAAIGTTAAIGIAAGGGTLAAAGGVMLGTRFFESSCRLGLGPTTHSAPGTIPSPLDRCDSTS